MPEPRQVIETGGFSLAERLAHKLGAEVDARHIFGEPVEREGVTVIPVARAAYGFGGGGGKKGEEEGSGGGGGVAMKPVGYIEIRNDKTRFRSIHDPFVYAAVITALAPLVIFTALRLTRIFRKSES